MYGKFAHIKKKDNYLSFKLVEKFSKAIGLWSSCIIFIGFNNFQYYPIKFE